MNRRGWIGWIESNPVAAAVFSFLMGISLASAGFLAAEVGVGDPAPPSIQDPTASGTTGGTTGGTTTGGATTGGATTGTTTGTTTGDTTGTTTGTSGSSTAGTTTGGSTSGTTTGGATTGTTGDSTSGTTGGSTSGTSGTGGTTSDGSTSGTTTGGSGGTTDTGTGASAPCAPDPDYTMTGVTPDEVVIGQITSEVNFLPQQFAPVREGLEAYLKQLNESGGVCGRTIRLEDRNDQANPSSTQSQYDQLVSQVFVFVGNTSLQDNQMYEGQKPFNPRSSDDGEYLPDIGGFALGYLRAQSPWFAGPLGSVSPTLVGGVAFRGFADELAAEGTECTRAGVLYLNEPTGASRDQAALGVVSIEEPWGMGLGEDSAELYEQQLGASRPQYRLTVSQMLNNGVDCVFTYADLQSNINLVGAAVDEGAWPRADCAVETRCFELIYQPFAGYDPAFIESLGDNALGVHTFVPHLPLEEAQRPAMAAYLRHLEEVDPAYAPSTFSIIGYASGAMFEDLLRACGSAPTRPCMHQGMQNLQNWTPDGLTGPITPYRTSRAVWDDPFGEYDFRWVFNCVNRLRVRDVGGQLQWARTGPANDYECGDIRVARSR